MTTAIDPQAATGGELSAAATAPRVFPDRRAGSRGEAPGVERRQFADSRSSERPEVNELAEAIDHYKLAHRRRFVTVEELYDIITKLGYSR